MRRRWLLKLCVFLLLGAAINIAVAWGCSLYSPIEVHAPSHPATESDTYWLRQLGWQSQQEWTDAWECDVLATHMQGHGVIYTSVEQIGRLPQDLSYRYDGAFPVADLMLQAVSGWPAPSLRGAVIDPEVLQPNFPLKDVRWKMSDMPFIFEGRPLWCVRSPTIQSLPDSGGRLVPLLPIWPGFAINTSFYAMTVWLIFAAPFTLRRRRRMKRGLCPACAYPVGASELCTECGKPVAAPNVGPAA